MFAFRIWTYYSYVLAHHFNYHYTGFVGNIYRSPNSSESDDSKLYEVINYVNEKLYGIKLIVGDFNFRNTDWNKWTTDTGREAKFLSCLRNNFMTQSF